MSHTKAFEARPAALAAAGFTSRRVGREMRIVHEDGSVEFHFFAKSGNKDHLARVIVDPDGDASVVPVGD